MSFADNLKTVRKERGISQEELAELLEVSRQSVSKWEQGMGYPEVEKIISLSKALNVSLDYLLCDTVQKPSDAKIGTSGSGRLMIKAHDGRSIVSCYKVVSSCLSNGVFKIKPGMPQYALFGVDGISFWGDNSILLGWYADNESITAEVDAIMAALQSGAPSYDLQFAANVKQGFLSLKIVE